MAWQPYVDELMKNGNLDHGAVCGAADGLIWAADPGFKLSEYDTDVHVDIDNVQKIHVNEQATLLESKFKLYTSLLHQGTSFFQGWYQNQWCQVRHYHL